MLTILRTKLNNRC